MGAPHLDSEMWESTNPTPPFSTQHEPGCPTSRFLRCGKAQTSTIPFPTQHEPRGAPSFAHFAKGGKAQTSTSHLYPVRTLGAPSFAHFAKGGKAQTSTFHSPPGTTKGAPILRALCEGCDSTNLNLPFSTQHEPRAARGRRFRLFFSGAAPRPFHPACDPGKTNHFREEAFTGTNPLTTMLNPRSMSGLSYSVSQVAPPHFLESVTPTPIRSFFEALHQYAILCAKMEARQTSHRPIRRSS